MTETTDFALCRDRLDDLAVRAVGTCSSVARAFLGQGPGLDDPSVTRKLEELARSGVLKEGRAWRS